MDDQKHQDEIDLIHKLDPDAKHRAELDLIHQLDPQLHGGTIPALSNLNNLGAIPTTTPTPRKLIPWWELAKGMYEHGGESLKKLVHSAYETWIHPVESADTLTNGLTPADMMRSVSGAVPEAPAAIGGLVLNQLSPEVRAYIEKDHPELQPAIEKGKTASEKVHNAGQALVNYLDESYHSKPGEATGTALEHSLYNSPFQTMADLSIPVAGFGAGLSRMGLNAAWRASMAERMVASGIPGGIAKTIVNTPRMAGLAMNPLNALIPAGKMVSSGTRKMVNALTPQRMLINAAGENPELLDQILAKQDEAMAHPIVPGSVPTSGEALGPNPLTSAPGGPSAAPVAHQPGAPGPGASTVTVAPTMTLPAGPVNPALAAPNHAAAAQALGLPPGAVQAMLLAAPSGPEAAAMNAMKNAAPDVIHAPGAIPMPGAIAMPSPEVNAWEAAKAKGVIQPEWEGQPLNPSEWEAAKARGVVEAPADPNGLVFKKGTSDQYHVDPRISNLADYYVKSAAPKGLAPEDVFNPEDAILVRKHLRGESTATPPNSWEAAKAKGVIQPPWASKEVVPVQSDVVPHTGAAIVPAQSNELATMQGRIVPSQPGEVVPSNPGQLTTILTNEMAGGQIPSVANPNTPAAAFAPLNPGSPAVNATNWAQMTKDAEANAGTDFVNLREANNNARQAHLQATMAQTPEVLERATAHHLALSDNTNPATRYGRAYRRVADGDAQLHDILSRPLSSGVVDRARTIMGESRTPFQVGTNAAGYPRYSGEALDAINSAFNDLAFDPNVVRETGISSREAHAIQGTRDEFRHWVGQPNKNPELIQAINEYRDREQVLAQMKIGQTFSKILSNPLSTSNTVDQRLGAFRKALTDPLGEFSPTGNKKFILNATGSKLASNVEDIATPAQMQMLHSLNADLEREAFDSERAIAGKKFAGKLNTAASDQVDLKSLKGVPGIVPDTINAITQLVTSPANKRVAERMTNALKTPEGAAKLIRDVKAQQELFDAVGGTIRGGARMINNLTNRIPTTFSVIEQQRDAKKKKDEAR